MLKVESLTKRYGNQVIVNNLNFEVEKGKIVGFLGSNGSGKTTTLNMISGLLGQSSGRIEVCGFDTIEDSKKSLKNLGYLPDNPPLFHELKVEAFIALQAQLRGMNKSLIQEEVQRVLKLCDLTSVRRKYISKLSKGFRQRVGLASVLVHSPQVLILDEPTDGLDPEQIQSFRNVLKTVAENSAVLLSTHILGEAESVCDEVLIIKKGALMGDKISLLETDDFEIFEFQLFMPTQSNLKEISKNYDVVSVKEEKQHSHLKVKIPLKDKNNSISQLNADLCKAGAKVFGISPVGKVLEERFLNIVRGDTH